MKPTSGMIQAFELAAERPVGRNSLAGIEAVLVIAEREYAARIEGRRGQGLCDCDDADDDPINPMNDKLMEHHCDCAAVRATEAVLGDATLTHHHAECVCGRSR